MPERPEARVRTAAALLLALAIASCTHAPDPPRFADCPAREPGMAALDAFMTAWNSKNPATYESALHFPHVRLAAGRAVVQERPGLNPRVFDAAIASGWDRTAWASRELVQCGATKAHFATEFIRYRADGSEIGRWPSLYIVEQRGGRWAVSARSSFLE